MSTVPAHDARMTMEEYFRTEPDSPVKRDYLGGEAVAMAGGSPRHSLVTMNIGREAGNKIARKPCSVYDSNLLIGIPNTPYTHYPDATIVCGPLELDKRDPGGHTIVNPLVIFEVLSPSTAGFDRGEKFDRYRTLDRFREYVLVFQDRPEVLTFFRDGDGTWVLNFASGVDAKVTLRSLDVTLEAAEIYRGVTFDPPPEADGGRNPDAARE